LQRVQSYDRAEMSQRNGVSGENCLPAVETEICRKRQVSISGDHQAYLALPKRRLRCSSLVTAAATDAIKDATCVAPGVDR
jgi:NifU-like protein involved in Fe-S cluster formation